LEVKNGERGDVLQRENGFDWQPTYENPQAAV
jgi:hypothetical protein